MVVKTPIYERPAELLQNLIRFDTTNPPGNERPCIEYINSILKDAGFQTELIAKASNRPNLVTRLEGTGNAPPLLLYGHVDVVTTADQEWTHPPFEAKNVDGFIWGRGALDMKHGIAMYLSALLKARAENLPLPGDVIFVALVDEEAGDEYGASYLVKDHPHLFKGVRYALGEYGGFNQRVAGKRFYPIMISEKQACWMKATFRGMAGHGALPLRGQAVAKLGRALKQLDETPLPIKLTQPVRLMMTTLASNLGGIQGTLLRQILNPVMTGTILRLLGAQRSVFEPLLRNTVSPTMISGSDKINVIPSQVTCGLDGRLVPGATPEELVDELHAILGKDVDIEVVKTEPGPDNINMELFDTLGGILQELDPSGIPLPMVLPHMTDARFFSLLGIQTYGYTPVLLPDDFNFISYIHAADERIPVNALDFGVQALTQAIQRFH